MHGYGGIPLCLLLFLTACASDPEIVEVPVVVEREVVRAPSLDSALFARCDSVRLDTIRTNGELLDALLEANGRLAVCDEQVRTIRDRLQ